MKNKLDTKSLPSGDYIAGFVDGEGCFALKFRRDVKRNKGNGKLREYFYWGLEFVIALKFDDENILKLIQERLDCGHISFTSKGDQVRFSVQNPGDIISKIIPFFEKYRLFAKKKEDFELWKEATFIIGKYRDGQLNLISGQRGFIKKGLAPEDTMRLNKIRDLMLTYKASRPRPFKYGG